MGCCSGGCLEFLGVGGGRGRKIGHQSSMSITQAVRTSLFSHSPRHAASPVSERLNDDASPLEPFPGGTTDFAKMHLHRDSGRQVEKFYKQVKLIGTGCWAEVYLAKNKVTSEERAIKCLKKTNLQDREFVANEIHAMLRLDHPNVVKFYEFFESRDSIYVVTEYCSEGDFKQLQGGRCPIDEVRLLFHDVVTGVAYCHGLGIAHRDLKFENCLITAGLTATPAGSPGRRIGKVIDFGFAVIKRKEEERDEDWVAESGALGTWFFVAPEVVMKKPYGEKCDMWALGVMLYIVLAHHHPVFHSGGRGGAPKTIKEAVRAVCKKPIDFDALDGPSREPCDPNARDLVEKLLVRDPTERIDASSALKMPWLESEHEMLFKDYLEKNGQFRERILTFAELPLFSRMALMLLAQQASAQGTQDARAAFLALDVDAEGWISQQDLEEGFAASDHDLTPQQLESLYKALDVNGNGQVSWVEWLGATISCRSFSSDAAAWELFKTFDTDNDQKISRRELIRVLGSKEADRVLEDLDSSTGPECTNGQLQHLGWEDFRGLVKEALQRETRPTKRKLPGWDSPPARSRMKYMGE